MSSTLTAAVHVVVMFEIYVRHVPTRYLVCLVGVCLVGVCSHGTNVVPQPFIISQPPA